MELRKVTSDLIIKNVWGKTNMQGTGNNQRRPFEKGVGSCSEVVFVCLPIDAER